MKVFEFNEESNFDYPEDMKIIMEYLNNVGKVHVSESTIERLYFDFSSLGMDVASAIWLIPNDYWLSKFAKWLSEQNV